MKKTLKDLGIFISGLILLVSCGESYDLVIRNGEIYDGMGTQPFIADIGIKDGIIARIGEISTTNGTIIDASGLIVTPGFIDMHTHVDRSFGNHHLFPAVNYVSQGVTTVVTGNCGSGTYQVEETFSIIDSIGFGTNIVHLVGHNTVRKAVMGMEDRAPTKTELLRMKELVAEAMEGGATGFSSGLFYAPGSYAENSEIIELAKTVRAYDGIYASHIRDESDYSIGIVNAIFEAIEVGRQAGVPVEISHIKALGKPVWGYADSIISIIEDARSEGIVVMADQYPYSASSTSLSAAVIPSWVLADGNMKANLADKSLLPGIADEIAGNIYRRGGPESIVVVSFPQNPLYSGKSIVEISELKGLDYVQTVIYLCLNGSPGIISFNMQDSDINQFMAQDWVLTGSDGHIPVSKETIIHPRSYGSFSRKIRKYVLEDSIITLEKAIISSTALPAQMLKLKNRGMIKEGFAADMVLIDLNTIKDEADYSNPQKFSSGIPYVLVNGSLAIDNGEPTHILKGKALRLNEK